MTAERLLAYFDRIAEAPEAVQRLRRFILDLAVRGKLVPPEIGPASPVVDSTAVHVHQKAKTKIADQKAPFALPVGWYWSRLECLSALITDGEHATPPRIVEHQIPLVSAKNVRDGRMDYYDTDWVSYETAEKAWRRCRPQVGDILLVCVGATTGRLTVLYEPKDMVLVRSVALIRAKNSVMVDYLAMILRSSMCQSQMWDKVKATAQPCLYINRINSLMVPVPPLAEQQRIVAKVRELMDLCDRLEAQLAAATQARSQLLEAVLQEALWTSGAL